MTEEIDYISKRLALLGRKKVDLERNTMKYYIFHSGLQFGSQSSMFDTQRVFPIE